MRPLRILAVLAFVLVVATSCRYNDHRTMGATQKLATSDVTPISKMVGTMVVGIGESFIAPIEATWDYTFNDRQYADDHEYLSYAGTRTLKRDQDQMGAYMYAAYPFTVLIETVWLIVTLPVDAVYELAGSRDGPETDA